MRGRRVLAVVLAVAAGFLASAVHRSGIPMWVVALVWSVLILPPLILLAAGTRPASDEAGEGTA